MIQSKQGQSKKSTSRREEWECNPGWPQIAIFRVQIIICALQPIHQARPYEFVNLYWECENNFLGSDIHWNLYNHVKLDNAICIAVWASGAIINNVNAKVYQFTQTSQEYNSKQENGKKKHSILAILAISILKWRI